MTDILIRICVGACGLTVITVGILGTADNEVRGALRLLCAAFILIGLVSILRALGVL